MSSEQKNREEVRVRRLFLRTATGIDQVESACARYGVNVHVSPFRHKYFWDAGIHCITNDLDRASSGKGKFVNATK